MFLQHSPTDMKNVPFSYVLACFRVCNGERKVKPFVNSEQFNPLSSENMQFIESESFRALISRQIFER